MTPYATEHPVPREGPAPFDITDVLNIQALTALFQTLTQMNDVVTALLDLKGKVLIATGWRNSCTLFHRVHETTAARCLESDTALASALAEGSHYNVYNCRNGLVDVAVPVRVDGYHVGNLFTGQFFADPPDIESFRAKARLYGFDEEAYIAAILAVPVFSKAEIERTMAFLVLLAENLGQMGLANRKLADTNAELERHRNDLERLVEERTAALRDALDEAQQANRAKSRFLASMSHEIRTPMNAILGFSEVLLRNADATPSQRQGLRIIERSGQHLLGLIDEVLEISRVDAGKAVLREDHFRPIDALEDVLAMFEAPCASLGLPLVADIDPSLNKPTVGDSGKIRQVWINLVGNAIKFARRGPVQVRARLEEVAGGGLRLIGEVEGDGPGIAPADHARIFEPFEQSASGQTKREGTGLGLAIAKAFVETMGGTISVRSDVDEGACFRFEAQLSATSERVGTEDAMTGDWLSADPPVRLLIVDDIETNRMVVQAMLEPMDVEVLQASDGESAIALARKTRPDFILMDSRMPGLGGSEATRQLADDPATSNIPIAILSASVLPTEQQLMRLAGAVEVLAKPVRLETLVQVLARHTHGRAVVRPQPNLRSARP